LSTDREGSEIRRLLADIERERGAQDSSPAPGSSAQQADRFVYSISYGNRRIHVGEVDLTPQLDRLIQFVVARGEEIPR
jgi:hypothetical protein